MKLALDDILNDFHGSSSIVVRAAVASASPQASSPVPLPANIVGNECSPSAFGAACGGSIFGGGLSSGTSETDEAAIAGTEPITPAQRSRRLLTFSAILGLLLMLLAFTACGQEMYGTIRIECGITNVYWTNVPAHVFLQTTADLQTWVDRSELRNIDGTPIVSFSYPLRAAERVGYYRLRIP